MNYQGKVYKFGNDVNTDEIIPARYLNTSDAQELAKHCMEDADASFPKNVRPGDIIAAGKNFGCGSSREHAPISIKACGVSCVVAESFARIFYRNAINIGLPIIELKDASQKINNGDNLAVDTDTGILKNLTTGKEYKIEKYPPFMQKIIKAGGLMNSIKTQIEK